MAVKKYSSLNMPMTYCKVNHKDKGPINVEEMHQHTKVSQRWGQTQKSTHLSTVN